MLFENADDGIDIMFSFHNDVLKKELPNSIFLPRCFAGNAGGHLALKGLFKSTKYEISKSESLCHFTTIQGLISILKGGYLRMTEFRHLSDINEIQFGAGVFKELYNEFKISDKLKDYKENCFSLSACISSENVFTNSFMWEAYANQSKGAIIEFNIQEANVESVLLGKILYGNYGLKSLKNINLLSHNFNKKYNFLPNDFPFEFIELLSFHKQLKYKDEKEVRLFVKLEKNKYNEHSHFATYKDITNSNNVRWFFRLFLEGRKDIFKQEEIKEELIKDYFSYYPTVKINKIILGNALSIEQKVEIVGLIREIKAKYNYNFAITHLNNENELLNWQ